tara:strand:- start:11935 stop:12342 length:408 start_codon:yes stop_codon:yes gene_type:complete
MKDMTKHEKSQEQFLSYKQKGDIIARLIKGQTREYVIELTGREHWRTYSVEFSFDNVYFFSKELVSFDIRLVGVTKQGSHFTDKPSDFKSRVSAGEYKRLLVDLTREAKNKLKCDVFFKSSCYGVRNFHINNVTV